MGLLFTRRLQLPMEQNLSLPGSRKHLRFPLEEPKPWELGLALLNSLSRTHSLLNKPSPALAQDCWLCLSFASVYIAIPVPLFKWNQAKATFTYKKEKGAIFLDKANTLLGNCPTNQASLPHLYSNPRHCSSHLHTCHRPCHPTHPANCPNPFMLYKIRGQYINRPSSIITLQHHSYSSEGEYRGNLQGGG